MLCRSPSSQRLRPQASGGAKSPKRPRSEPVGVQGPLSYIDRARSGASRFARVTEGASRGAGVPDDSPCERSGASCEVRTQRSALVGVQGSPTIPPCERSGASCEERA